MGVPPPSLRSGRRFRDWYQQLEDVWNTEVYSRGLRSPHFIDFLPYKAIHILRRSRDKEFINYLDKNNHFPQPDEKNIFI